MDGPSQRLTRETARVTLLPLTTARADATLAYHLRNRAHLAPWDPARPESFFTLAEQRARAADFERDLAADRSYRFGAFARAAMGDREPGELVATVSLSNVVRGVLQSANLGFSVDRSLQGHGVAYESVRAVMAIAFDSLGLHRLEAGHRTENLRSGALLARLGFERIGVARRYLMIDGDWRDHVLYQRLADEP